MVTPDIHNILTVSIGTDRSAHFLSFSKIVFQKVTNEFEYGVAGPLDSSHGYEQSFGCEILTSSS